MKLKLSKRGDYVVRSAISLANSFEATSPKKLRQVSVEMGVPRTFVAQILGDLVQAGIATSFFGTNGGYRLARSPSEVTLLEVVEAAEGPLETDSCVLGDEPCRWESVCPVHETWSAATSALRAELAATTLATLVERNRGIVAGTYKIVGHAHPHSNTIEVSDFVQIERAMRDVTEKFQGDGLWLIPLIEDARSDGEEVLVRVMPSTPDWLTKSVAVHIGEPIASNDAALIQIEWGATGPSGLFPRLEGTLKLTEIDNARSQMSLIGRYYPPLGRNGRALDDVVLAHVARSTIRSFLRRLAHALEER